MTLNVGARAAYPRDEKDAEIGDVSCLEKVNPDGRNVGANGGFRFQERHRPNPSAQRTQARRPRPRVRLRVRLSTFFCDWQPEYAAHGIATFPLHPNKEPKIKHWQKVGLRGSTKLAAGQFADAGAFGFLTGRRNKVTVLDVDTTDERFLADAIDRHGEPPIIVRTASGKWQLPYRDNGETRRIRPWDGLPIDLLGAGGFVVAMPSEINGGQYQFIQGRLDDLDCLPILKGLQPASNGRSLYVNLSPLDISQSVVSPLRGMREHDGRNNALLLAIGPQAREIFAAAGGPEQLFDYAMHHNREAAEPMATGEVADIVGSVWQMTVRGDNHIGMHGVYIQASEIEDLNSNSDAFYLLAFLRAHQGPSATFWITNGLAERFDWTVKRLASARSVLLERGLVRLIRRPSQGHPARYVWP